jgi:hypothetical protein
VSLFYFYSDNFLCRLLGVIPIHFFFLVPWGGVRPCPLGTWATKWPVFPALNDRWWVWSSRWNENWQGKSKYSEKTCPSATLSITNPTRPDLGSNPGRRGGKPATNRLSYTPGFHVFIFHSSLFPQALPYKPRSFVMDLICVFYLHTGLPSLSS